ncbi:hypothetical protein [Idiomarina sp.]|uniref:hypothetical protein n=1 Tax=Idiomarina sp. TaxID=1874361 RepID=UPI003A8F89B7
MNNKWPLERRNEKVEAGSSPLAKGVPDFVSLINVIDEAEESSFIEVVNWIVKQGESISELEKRIVEFADEIEVTLEEEKPALMALACAVALARNPSIDTWIKVNALKCESCEIESWLSAAMVAYVEIYPPACGPYNSLAKSVFSALDNFSLKSKSERVNKEREGVWFYWNDRQDKLEEVWFGLRSWSGFINYREELPLFEVFYKISPHEFIATISRSTNPYLLNALCLAAGIGAFYPKFSEWRNIIGAAPIAFEANGEWNGSVLLPLLLVEARDQLLQSRDPVGPSLTHDEHDGLEREIKKTAKKIVTALAERKDYLVIFSRWWPWLMRQILASTEEELTDVKSSAFSDNVLMNEIGEKLKGKSISQVVSSSVPLWEVWCHYCALAFFSHEEHIQTPNWKVFVDEWRLLPEDWGGDKGKALRDHSRLIIASNRETPGIAVNLLAYPIAQSSFPFKVWDDLWNNAYVLREIVEFGDLDAIEDEYSSRSEAGRLLLLLFKIGLAILDQIAVESPDEDSIEARTAAKLFNTLYFAASEMREIDSTLNHDKWFQMVQHLVIRRVIWEPAFKDEGTSLNFQVFKSEDVPTVSYSLLKEKSDPTRLIAILQSLLLNTESSRLRNELSSASIDVSVIIKSIRLLNEYHPNKYPVDKSELSKIEKLLGEAN